MATDKGALVEERAVFDCPKCGVHHDGELRVEVESEPMDWDVGPPVETIALQSRQWFRTSACGDVFVTRSLIDEPTYEVTLTTYGDGRPTLLQVKPREADEDGV